MAGKRAFTAASLEAFQNICAILERHNGMTRIRIIEQLVGRTALEVGVDRERALIIANGIRKHAIELIEDGLGGGDGDAHDGDH
jgi:hypothetical protein